LIPLSSLLLPPFSLFGDIDPPQEVVLQDSAVKLSHPAANSVLQQIVAAFGYFLPLPLTPPPAPPTLLPRRG